MICWTKNPSLAKVLDILKNETKLRRIKKRKQNKNYQEIKLTIEDLQNKKITVGHCIEIIVFFLLIIGKLLCKFIALIMRTSNSQFYLVW